MLRTVKRSGLIRARLLGAAKVKGQVITFLDAHCECTEGWLEPLLARIAIDRRTVVCPIIDVISDETFEYVTASDQTWGGFNWKLNFRWYRVPQREMQRRNNDRTAPLRTPTMVSFEVVNAYERKCNLRIEMIIYEYEHAFSGVYSIIRTFLCVGWRTFLH